AYDARFALLWTAAASLPPGSVGAAPFAAADGSITVGTSTPDHQLTFTRFTGAGVCASQRAVPGDAFTVDGDQPIVAWSDGDTLRITRFDAAGAAVWADGFAGRAAITAMAIDPDHALVFGGQLFTAMDFGGGLIPLRQTDNGKLDA